MSGVRSPSRISGTCGRLMCCLKYEQAAYEDLIRTTPKSGAQVTTPDGRGTVTEANLLTGMLKVRLDDGDGTAIKVFHKRDLCADRGEAPPAREAPRPAKRQERKDAAREERPAAQPADSDPD